MTSASRQLLAVVLVIGLGAASLHSEGPNPGADGAHVVGLETVRSDASFEPSLVPQVRFAPLFVAQWPARWPQPLVSLKPAPPQHRFWGESHRAQVIVTASPQGPPART
ncbi:MAG: hypothetical protein JNG84_08605 [Archangium sp.]|nr:hypothetical protein [Archangium sp.]